MSSASMSNNQPSMHDRILFWGCFIALITTAFGFIARVFLVNVWAEEFGLDQAQAGRLMGIGIWPFAVSIIGFSLFIDRIGYKAAMFMAFLGQMIWAVMGVSAYFVGHGESPNPERAFQLLYWGSLILALGNGTVEAFINPLVATMFNKEKTKWLNILHAGWPGGLVLAGILTIFLGDVPWWIKVGLIAIPAIVYCIMLAPLKFPVNERVASGVSYREMLSEFGILGALVVGFLITIQLIDFATLGGTVEISSAARWGFVLLGVAIVVAFGLYTRALGRPFMFIMVLIMMPLATTEIGTDAWITGIMEGIAEGKFHSGWVLVYTSLIMMLLRFCAGPIVHKLSPLGLLCASAILAVIGLYTLSFTTGAMIFVAAALYGVGKSFLWPTTLGIVSEQTPKGGALTLNAIAGIGMLTVGTLGTAYIGALQSEKRIEAMVASDSANSVEGMIQDGQLTTVDEKSIYEVIRYAAPAPDKMRKLVHDKVAGDSEELARIVAERAEANDPIAEGEIILTGQQKEVWNQLTVEQARSDQKALANMAMFPAAMLIAYILLIAYFKSKGGYQAQHLQSVETPAEPPATPAHAER